MGWFRISRKDVTYRSRTSRTLFISRRSGTRLRSLMRWARRMGSSRRRKDATCSSTRGVASLLTTTAAEDGDDDGEDDGGG